MEQMDWGNFVLADSQGIKCTAYGGQLILSFAAKSDIFNDL